MKALTGHKSDTVVQAYVEKSKVQLDRANEAVSIPPTNSQRKRELQEISIEPSGRKKSKHEHPSSSSSSRPPQQKHATTVELNFANSTINAAIYLYLKALVNAQQANNSNQNEAMDEESENEDV